jgi:tyrosine-protein phosphatase SIW14
MEAPDMPRPLRSLVGALVALLLIGGPAVFAHWCTNQMRNLHEVRPGVLYRSGQMSLLGLRQAVHELGIKTIVSLRDAHRAGDPPPDLDEEVFCANEEIKFYRIPPARWYAEDGPAPVETGVRTFRQIMADPKNYPVLIHCFAGLHRTGAYCAIYRMEQEHWTNARAMAEMKSYGYISLDEEWDILGYLEVYQPTWKEPSDQPVVRRRPPVKPGARRVRHSKRSEE